MYCGNTSIIKDRLIEEFEPEKVIPFKINKEEAIKKYKDTINKKILLPNKFKKDSVIEKITGIYIPFWLYDCEGSGNIIATGKNITRRSSGDYIYTTTKEYKIIRKIDFAFEKVPTDGLLKIDNVLMNSLEPYDYSKLENFNVSYLSGFLAEKYDVDKTGALEDAKKRINNTVESKMKNIVRNENRYDSVEIAKTNTTIDIKKAEYALLPVWLLNIKYENNNYLCAVNGQTGKCAGDFLISKLKVAVLFLMLFLTFIVIYYAMLNFFSLSYINFTTDIMPMSLIIVFIIPYILLLVSKCKLRKLKKQMLIKKNSNIIENNYNMYLKRNSLEKISSILVKIIGIKLVCILIIYLLYIVVMIDMNNNIK